ncbi:hypothetical protein ABK040_004382 [Willaertia magna]
MTSLRYFYDSKYRKSINEKWSGLSLFGFVRCYKLEIIAGISSVLLTFAVRNWSEFKSPIKVSWEIDYSKNKLYLKVTSKYKDLSARDAMKTLRNLNYISPDEYIEDECIEVLSDREVEVTFSNVPLKKLKQFEMDRDEQTETTIKLAAIVGVISIVGSNWLKHCVKKQ